MELKQFCYSRLVIFVKAQNNVNKFNKLIIFSWYFGQILIEAFFIFRHFFRLFNFSAVSVYGQIRFSNPNKMFKKDNKNIYPQELPSR